MNNSTAFGERVVKNRWIIIIFSILLVLATGSGGKYIRFTNDGRVFFSKENPQLIALEELENTYTKNDNIYLALEPKTGDIFTRETLAAIVQLTEAAWQVPYSSRVDSLTNYQHTSAFEDDLVVEDLISKPLSLSDEELQSIKDIVFSEPMLVNRLVAPQGNITGINITVLKPGKSIAENEEIMAFVQKMTDSFKTDHPDITLYMTGGVPFDAAFGEVGMDDMSTLIPLMYLTMIVVVWLLLRSFAGAFATLLVIGFSTITAMGITGWLNILLTPAASMAPTIILTLAVADSIHILATTFHELQQGKTKNEAVIESLRVNMQPVFLTSLTTAIGFLGMNSSDAPPFRDLGNIVAMGVAAAYIYSMFFLPALLSILPLRARKVKQKNHEWIDAFGNFVVQRRTALFWGMLVIIIILISGIFRIDLNDRFVEYFDTRYPIRSDTDYIADNKLTGVDLIEYSISSTGSHGITEPDYLKHLESFVTWYKIQPETIHVSSFDEVMRRLNKNMHGDERSYYRIPDNRQLASQFLLLYEMSLPFGLDLNNQINIDKSATRMVVTLKQLSAKELRQLDTRARRWMKANLPDYMFSYGSGLSVIWSHISERNISSMLRGTGIALFLISLVLIIALRSIKYGLLSLIPNLIPALMAFGLWGYIFEEVGLAVSVVAAMSLGIVVDDTIHFLTKYLRARNELGLNAQDAVRKSFHIVGKAILTTSVVLVAGFMILTQSGFRINSAMGLLTAIAITFALFADCFFLPPLLMKADKD